MGHPDGKPELILAWPFIHEELKKQLDLNTSLVLREMSGPAVPQVEVLLNLAAERRILLRQIRRFKHLSGDPPARGEMREEHELHAATMPVPTPPKPPWTHNT